MTCDEKLDLALLSELFSKCSTIKSFSIGDEIDEFVDQKTGQRVRIISGMMRIEVRTEQFAVTAIGASLKDAVGALVKQFDRACRVPGVHVKDASEILGEPLYKFFKSKWR